MAEKVAAHRVAQGEPQRAAGCLARMGWIAGANALLVALAVLIARSERWTFTAKDVAFWALAGSAVVLRYVDWKRFSGTTIDGDPATIRDVRRYAARLLVCWSAVWTLAQTLELG